MGGMLENDGCIMEFIMSNASMYKQNNTHLNRYFCVIQHAHQAHLTFENKDKTILQFGPIVTPLSGTDGSLLAKQFRRKLLR